MEGRAVGASGRRGLTEAEAELPTGETADRGEPKKEKISRSAERGQENCGPEKERAEAAERVSRKMEIRVDS